MEVTILYSVWALTIFSLIYIPKNRLTEATIMFFFQQLLTWFLGLVTVEWHLLDYPVREFASVNKTSFTFEFLVFPVITVFYIMYYPMQRGILAKILYTSGVTTAILIPEIIVEKYTDLIEYIHWAWYVSWLSVYASFCLARIFHRWFFKFEKMKQGV